MTIPTPRLIVAIAFLALLIAGLPPLAWPAFGVPAHRLILRAEFEVEGLTAVEVIAQVPAPV